MEASVKKRPAEFLRKTFFLALLLSIGISAPFLVVTKVGPLLFSNIPNTDPPQSHFSFERLEDGRAVNGIAVGDFDGDGFEDVFAAVYPSGFSGLQEQASVLFKNREGVLQESTELFGLPADIFASSAMFADIDGDVHPELFVAEITWEETVPHTTVRVFKFDVVRQLFEEITTSTRLSSINLRSAEATFSFGDYDADGDIDLTLATVGDIRKYPSIPNKGRNNLTKLFLNGGPFSDNYCGEETLLEQLEEEAELTEALVRDYGSIHEFATELKGCISFSSTSLHTPAVTRSFTWNPFAKLIAPRATLPGAIFLFKNEGGEFIDASEGMVYSKRTGANSTRTGVSGISRYSSISDAFFQTVSFDFTGDGLVDIFASSDGGRNLFFVNQGDFTFVDEGVAAGIGIKGTGMGIALVDVYREDNPDVFVTNFGQLFNFNWDKDSETTFSLDERVSLNRLGYGWGIVPIDFNNDSWTDIYISNGTRAFRQEQGIIKTNTAESIEDVTEYSIDGSLTRNVLYKNKNGKFIDVSGVDVPDVLDSSRPVSVVDLNNDGYEDVLIGFVGGYLPDTDKTGLGVLMNAGGSHAYTQVVLKGRSSAESGVGARIVLTHPDLGESKTVLIGDSFSAQSSLVKTFGLGEYDEKVVEAIIYWPSGITQKVFLNTGERNLITEAES